MRVIAIKRLREFWTRHPQAETPLRAWYQVMRHSEFPDWAGLRRVFPTASHISADVTVFNIGGNNFRLSVSIRYHRGRVYVRRVMTHAEYDRHSRAGTL